MTTFTAEDAAQMMQQAEEILAWADNPRITIWRTGGYDPDWQDEVEGILASESDAAWYIVNPLNQRPQPFFKSVWRESGRTK